jgi:signal transduction histidine kinase
VNADATRVGQVLRNLLANAATHTPAGGRIEVAARAADGVVTVSVRDTGPGIAAEHLPRVFERFYRADPSRARATGGAGLGLAIVKGIVEAHGGTVAAASPPGEGLTVRFTLPVAP